MVTVRIENSYTDGHESKSIVTVREPNEGEDLDDWFQDAVFPHTGDGHGIDSGLGSCYTARVLASDDPALVGETNEWMD